MVKIVFDDTKLSLKGKCSSVKFVIDCMWKQKREIGLTVYGDLQRVHTNDSFALRLRIKNGKLHSSNMKKLNALVEAYGFQDFGTDGIEREIKKYIEKKNFIFFEDKVQNYVQKYKIEGEQLKDLNDLLV